MGMCRQSWRPARPQGPEGDGEVVTPPPRNEVSEGERHSASTGSANVTRVVLMKRVSGSPGPQHVLREPPMLP